ncbi:MBOAT family O-acyltransferase [Pseudomonas entomophila]|uniref:Probable alginate O-acetylase n=2 Tax=Pseudomonas entomophila TaxID=312306 RepID=Q1IFK8_PSEE4|nr:MBOAT family O-acyltransferase [Pseudomonas entomophila]WMW05618.1 MBOAT family O-acyltransferase [Pseudomonas entomophila]CAK13546.1 putative alginate biosynthesis protein AlgI-like [Pseudomonas entomophila L48]
MSFLSIEFGLCFTLFFLLYWCLCWSVRLQNLLLLAASYGLVASFSLQSLYILLGYSTLVYLLGLMAGRHPGRWFNGALLLTLVLGCFYLFKYQEFFVGGIQGALASAGLEVSLPLLEVLVPIGLSFYAFHSVSYLVSISRRELAPAAPLDLALYLAFFPSLVAGPVNRALHMLPQIRPQAMRQVLEPHRALGLIAMAVVKLFFLSAWLGSEWVDPVFDTPGSAAPEQVLLSVYGYSFLIYFNFSGYTNLVTGIALLLGFRLPDNFDAPYAAHNLKEFWGRWHISLSRFIRDYVYIPLGGNRKGVWRGNLNMLLAMLVSGLWHGASVNFIIWGALHGVGLAISKLFSQLVPGFERVPGAGLLARLMTFHYVAFAWIFFRSPTLDGAVEMLGDITQLSLAGLNSAAGAMLLACVLFVAIYPLLLAVLRQSGALFQRLPWQLYPIPLGVGVSLVIFASQSGVPGFIYASF